MKAINARFSRKYRCRNEFQFLGKREGEKVIMARGSEDISQRDSNISTAELPFSYDETEIYTEAPAAQFRLGRGTVMSLVINRMIGECMYGEERRNVNVT
jgi:hypothetical protein